MLNGASSVHQGRSSRGFHNRGQVSRRARTESKGSCDGLTRTHEKKLDNSGSVVVEFPTVCFAARVRRQHRGGVHTGYAAPYFEPSQQSHKIMTMALSREQISACGRPIWKKDHVPNPVEPAAAFHGGTEAIIIFGLYIRIFKESVFLKWLLCKPFFAVSSIHDTLRVKFYEYLSHKSPPPNERILLGIAVAKSSSRAMETQKKIRL